MLLQRLLDNPSVVDQQTIFDDYINYDSLIFMYLGMIIY